MKRLFFICSSLALPLITFAQDPDTGPDLTPIKSGIYDIADILRLLIPIAFGLAVLFFFWNMAQFILHLNDSETVLAQKKRGMVIGVAILFIMSSIWGIVTVGQKMLGVKGGGVMDIPGVDLPERPSSVL